MFISSVNEMLLQSDENTVNVLPAFKEDCGDVSFRLAVKGGAIAEVSIKNSLLESIKITMGQEDVTDKYKVLFRGESI